MNQKKSFSQVIGLKELVLTFVLMAISVLFSVWFLPRFFDWKYGNSFIAGVVIGALIVIIFTIIIIPKEPEQ
jgi:hypothetical protein